MFNQKCHGVRQFSPYLVLALAAGILGGCGGSSDAPTSNASETVTPEVDARPTISGTPATTALVDSSYSFQPSASEGNAATLSFSIENKPSWANFSATTGQLDGTPTASDVGTTSPITISVSDGTNTASLAPFTISVTNPTGSSGSPPTLSGSPPTQIQAGQLYTFTPSATDPSGSPLTFSIQNKPSWATFSAATGELSGIPSASDVGNYENILISASDGSATAQLNAFAITVASAVATNATAMVTWSVPTLNTDGTTLTDLVGYTINYGTSAAQLTQTVSISDPTTTTYTIQGLTAGTWYFTVSANASDGTQSAPSNALSKTIP